MALSIDGLITGIDTQSIVEGLLRIQQSRIDSIEQQKLKLTTQRTAFISYEAQILAFQASLRPLARNANNALNQKLAVSSDEEALTATATSQAVNGSYSLRVEQLATNHVMASQSFGDPEQSIGTGTFAFTVKGTTKTITIDGTNDTMQGLANAINAASDDVSATIVASGTSASPAYQLLLSSNNSGVASSITLSNSLNTLVGGAIRPAFDDPAIAAAAKKATNTGTSVMTSNAGTGVYTGGVNDTFTFTVATGGTVGTTNGITLNYSNLSGSKTGTITVNSGDTDLFKTVVDGVQVKMGAGTLTAGDIFTVDVHAKQPPLQAARDAVVAFGDSAQAIRFTGETNRISGAIPGLVLNLAKADPDRTIQLDVGYDNEAILESVDEFTTAYNDFIDFVSDQTQYVPETDTASPLTGNRTVLQFGARLRSELVRTLPAGINEALNNLQDMGFAFDGNQRLIFRRDRLDEILNGEVEGVSPADLKRLFALEGASSNPSVSFVSATGRTISGAVGRNGESVRVQVKVTQAAERATFVGTALADSSVITTANDTVDLRYNGVTKSLKLNGGTYTRDALAAELNSRIRDAFGDQVASASVNGTSLQLQSTEFGEAVTLLIGSGTAVSTLGFQANSIRSGTNVAGSFVVVDANGAVLATESATGSGQRLRGQSADQEDENNPRNVTADLDVQVALGATEIAAEVDATITLTQGLGFRLGRIIDDGLTNALGNAKEEFVTKLDSLDESLERINAIFTSRREALLKQFTALEQSVSGFNSVSQLITGQLSAFRVG